VDSKGREFGVEEEERILEGGRRGGVPMRVYRHKGASIGGAL
jgi:hypothetical protein